MADALLPALRRSFEDVIYETLDARQVPNRTDFKELRDQVNALRGQLAGATGGVKRHAEQLEGVEDRLAAIEARLEGLEGKLKGDLRQEIGAVLDARTGHIADLVRERLSNQLDRLEARLSEPWLDARLIRSRDELMSTLAPRIESRADRATLELRLAELRAEQAMDRAALAALAARLDALASAPAPAAPVQAEPTQAEPTQAEPTQAEPVQAAPVQAEPIQADAESAPTAQSSAAALIDEETCKAEGCAEPVRSKGFCARHYQQWRRGKLPGFPSPDA